MQLVADEPFELPTPLSDEQRALLNALAHEETVRSALQFPTSTQLWQIDSRRFAKIAAKERDRCDVRIEVLRQALRNTIQPEPSAS